jgi:CheY-like chemotaxis protein
MPESDLPPHRNSPGGTDIVRFPAARPVADGTDPLSLSVLIVDDYPDMAESLAEFLALDGHPVRFARSCADALQLAWERAPDVVLIDLSMPDGSAYELAYELAALPGGPPLIIAVGGYRGDAHRAVEAAIAYHFLKGRSPAELQAYLRAAVR